MAAKKPESVFVRPNRRRLGPGEFVAGVPTAGIELPLEQAQPLLDSGVVVRYRPAPKPATAKE